MLRVYGLIFCLMVLMVPGALFAQDKTSSDGGANDKTSSEVVRKSSVSKNARESKTTKKSTSSSSSSKKKSTSSSKKKSSSKKSSSSKKKSSTKDPNKIINDHDSSPSKLTFSQAQIDEYKSMPYETWESPMGTSELGLPIEDGFAQPYPYGNLMRQYDGNKCRHRGLDIGVVGNVGTVVNAVTRSVVTLIGKTGENVGEFGKQDTRTGMAIRTGREYPRQMLVPGYGVVYPFSRSYGRWRSGTVIVTRVLDGPLKDYVIRYMHLADVRPDLKVGSVVEAGEHIALMGGTAVMDSYPHVHMDMETPDKKRVDLGPYLGLPGTGVNCGLSAPVVTPGKTGTSSKVPQVSKPAKSSSKSKTSIIKTTSVSQGTYIIPKAKNTSDDDEQPKHRRRPNYISVVPVPDAPVIKTLEREP